MQYVVVGNGIAGISAAQTIRRFNKESSITIISEEPQPAYSACLLPNYLSGELSRERVFIRRFSDYSRMNIQLVSGKEANSLDLARKSVVMKSENIPYDKLIIATGSKPLIPPIKGTDKKGVFTLKSLEQADMIQRWEGHTVVVVGSGPIGIEAGLALKKKGYRVFLVELLHRILPQVFDEQPASIVKEILESAGIEVSTHERVLEIMGAESVHGVVTVNRTIKCDTVILATGMGPETGLVAGVIETGKSNGILADDRMRTTAPDIFVCGDCAEARSLISARPVLSLLWHNARLQGQVAGSNAAGVPRTYCGSLDIVGVDLLGAQAVSIGSTAAAVEKGLDVIERKRGRRYQRLILSNGVLVGAQSVNWSENMGSLLTALMRKEKIKSSKDLIIEKRPPLVFLRYFPFGQKSTWRSNQH